jgi:methionyl-tRNA formyltransferase
VKVVAEAASVPLYQPSSLRNSEAAERLRAWAPEAIVVAAYGQILRPHVLELPPRGCLNVHASLLPRWRGASPIQHAILAGDEESGVSLMQMDVGLDTGPVYVQEAVPLRPDETAESLHDRLAELGGQLVRRHLTAILAGEIPATPQEEAKATYAPMISKEDGRISWEESGAQLDRHVRAMTPWPSAFTSWEGKRLKVLATEPAAAAGLPAVAPGTVIEHDGAVVVVAGEGGLRLLAVQPAGRQVMAIDDFVRGRPDFVGSRLGE